MKTISVGILFIFILLNSINSFAKDWPMFMGNLQRTGQAVDTSLASISGLKLNWQHALNSSVSASPVIAEEKLLIAAENGNLYNFDWPTKKLLWIYHTEGGIGSTPAVANGIVYFLSRDGYFYAITLANAQLVWRFKTQGEKTFSAFGGYALPLSQGPIVDAWDFYLSSPLIHNNKVYFGSSDEHVYALDTKTGALHWAFKGDEMFHASPAFANNTIFIGSLGTRLYALDAETGEKRWDFQGGADRRNSVMLGFVAAPTLDETRVYIGGRDAQFYALNMADGKLQWSYNLQGSWVLSTAAMDAENIYLTTSDTGLVLALDKITGDEKYRFDTHFWNYASPLLLANRFIFAASMSGNLYGLDKTTGKLVWHYQTQEGKTDSMDIIDDKTGKLLNEKIFAQDRQLQASIEHVKELGAFLASPVWFDNQLIAVTANGKILIFK